MRVNTRKVLSREKAIKILRNVFSVTAFAKPFQRECIGAWMRMREGGKLCQWLIQRRDGLFFTSKDWDDKE